MRSLRSNDHKTKLFWCFYGFGQIPDIVGQQQLFEMHATAADIHANRIAGLYVENSDLGLRVPSQAISPRQTQALIGYAEVVISYAESQRPRDDIPQEDIDALAEAVVSVDARQVEERCVARAR